MKKRTESDRFLRQALVGLLGLKLQSGCSLEEIQKLSRECIALAASKNGSNALRQGLDIHRLGSVLRDWHRETRYLLADGNPSPLTYEGRGGLRGLIGSYYPSSKIDAVFSALKRAGLIRRHGKGFWTPTETHARISAHSQETLDHVSEGVSRFLETVLNNINSESKAGLLFEQSCKVRQLPMSHASAFRVFVREQAISFLTAVDDWLEARVDRSTHTRRVSNSTAAGVFAFAYLDTRKDERSAR
jgi:hypothetical protein